MRILITGGAGFIGSHLVDKLTARNHTLIVIDDLSRGSRCFIPDNIPLYVIDIASSDAATVVKNFLPEIVIHLAAQMDVSASIGDPVADARINIMGTLNILHEAQRVGTSVFVSMSSGGALYGNARTLPTSESEPIAPLSPYGASKFCTEVYLQLMSRTTSMRCVSLRLSNVYGPRQSIRGEAGVVAIFARTMLNGQSPIIFGDGQQTRDFVYVMDVCDAIDKCITNKHARGSYNISTGVQTSILELIAALRNPTNYYGHVNFGPALHGEVTHSCLTWNWAAENLQWHPKVLLTPGLSTTVKFLRSTERTMPQMTSKANQNIFVPRTSSNDNS